MDQNNCRSSKTTVEALFKNRSKQLLEIEKYLTGFFEIQRLHRFGSIEKFHLIWNFQEDSKIAQKLKLLKGNSYVNIEEYCITIL